MRYTFDAYLPDGSPRRHVGTFRPPYEEARETLMPGALAISSARGPDTWTPYMAGLADRPLYELEDEPESAWIPLGVGSLVAATDSETGAVGRYEVARVSLEHLAIYLGTPAKRVGRQRRRQIDEELEPELGGSGLQARAEVESYSDETVSRAVLVNALCHAILKPSGGLPGNVLVDLGDTEEFASEIAETLLGREIAFGWKSLQPGKVVAVHDARTGRTATLRVKDCDVAEDGGSGTILLEPLPPLPE